MNFWELRMILMPQQINLFDALQNGQQNSAGGGGRQRKIFAHTYDDIISVENLLEAWKEFLRGKRNKQDVHEFQADFMHNILLLHHDLVSQTYRHGGYQHFKIADPKPRDIHKASVRDRLLHHAIYRILYPFFDRAFTADSFSCRDRKGTHKALERFKHFSYIVSKNNTVTCWVLKCDIRKFFASIDQAILYEIIKKYITDPDILALLLNVIQSFNSGRPGFGLPLGNLTSQLFVNIYMNEFDQFMKHKLKAKFYMRYADDFVIFSDNKHEVAEMIEPIGDFLKNSLNLKLHPNKVYIKTLDSGVDFLGWIHFIDHRVLRTVTQRRMWQKLEGASSSESVASYDGLLWHGNAGKLRKRLTLFLIDKKQD